jgi:hypothetical protein
MVMCFGTMLGMIATCLLHQKILRFLPSSCTNSLDCQINDDLSVDASGSLSLPEPNVLWKNFNDKSFCISDECMKFRAARMARAWHSKRYQDWCYTSTTSNQFQTASTEITISSSSGGGGDGLRLIKVPKSASSTMAGIVLRIQHRHNCTRHVHWEHGIARNVLDHAISASRSTSSFLIAPIRTPERRALSNVYFHDVSFHNAHRKRPQQRLPRDDHIIQKLERIPSNFILDYVTTDPIYNDTAAHCDLFDSSNTKIESQKHKFRVCLDRIERNVANVLATYDFLVIVDRLPESLAVWSILSELPIHDFLSLSSKLSGMWYAIGYNHRHPKCIQLVTPVETDGIQQYFHSVEWQKRHYGDRLLYHAASISLTQTINQLGIDRVDQVVKLYHHWHQHIQDSVCVQKMSYFPCTSNGTPQMNVSRQYCYTRDFGCGYHCIDNIVDHKKS